MSPIDALPPDQQAVLALLLKQGRTYDDIATMLRIDREAVRARAFAAAEALVPDQGVDRDRRAQINDYLLGQQSASERQATRDALAVLAPERAWGRALVAELQPLAAHPLPEIPADEAEVREAFQALDDQRAADDEQDRQTRLGMILLLGGLAVVVVIVIVLLVSGGGSDDNKTTANPPPTSTKSAATSPSTATTPATTPDTGPSTTPTTTTPATDTTTSTTPSTTTIPSTSDNVKALAQINLASPSGAKQPFGVAELIKLSSGDLAVNVVARGLAPSGDNFAYGMWVTSKAGKQAFLGFGRVVGANGQLKVLGELPAEASEYDTLLMTKEIVASPSKPGTTVLKGPLPRGTIATNESKSSSTSPLTTTSPSTSTSTSTKKPTPTATTG